MTELFEIPQVLSPRLAWMKKNNLTSRHDERIEIGSEDEISGKTLYPWLVCDKAEDLAILLCEGRVGFGNTEDEAITAWAKANGVKLWNEE